MEDRKEETVELEAQKLEKVNGGCWFWGLFGTHNGYYQETFSVRTDDGTLHEYGKFQCEDCGKMFYTDENLATGVKEEISEADYTRLTAGL